MTGLSSVEKVPFARNFTEESVGDSDAAKALLSLLLDAKKYRTAETTGEAQLISIENDCIEQGWDGYNASAISSETIGIAREILESLPSVFPTPDVIPEPDGEIALEWEGEEGAIFSISISKTGLLSHAGSILEGQKLREVSGQEQWNGWNIPEKLMEYISRVNYP